MVHRSPLPTRPFPLICWSRGCGSAAFEKAEAQVWQGARYRGCRPPRRQGDPVHGPPGSTPIPTLRVYSGLPIQGCSRSLDTIYSQSAPTGCPSVTEAHASVTATISDPVRLRVLYKPTHIHHRRSFRHRLLCSPLSRPKRPRTPLIHVPGPRLQRPCPPRWPFERGGGGARGVGTPRPGSVSGMATLSEAGR